MQVQNSAVQVRLTEDQVNTGLSMILYGEPGIGKTHAVNFLPNKTTLYLGFEGGEEPLIGKDIHIINFVSAQGKDSLVALKQILDAIKNRNDIEINGVKIQTSSLTNVVIDNISELERYLQIGLMKYRNKSFMTLKEYGDASQKMKEYMRDIRDFKSLGIYVTAIAHEQLLEEKDELGDTCTKYYPQISVKIMREIMGMFDIVGRMEREHYTNDSNNLEFKRIIRIAPNQKVSAKCRITGFVEKYGETFSQDIGDLYRCAYKLRKERILGTQKKDIKIEKKEKEK
jgi:phage nucleotide-binding protein